MHWFAAPVLTLVALLGGLSAASAKTIIIDDFTQLGSVPPTGTNYWNQGGLTNVHGGVRAQTKTGGAGSTWSSGTKGLSLTTTSSTLSNWEIIYDGVLPANVNLPAAFTSFPNPSPGPIDISQSTGWLRVVMDSVAPNGTGTSTFTRPSVIATLKWSNTATGSLITSTLEVPLQFGFASSYFFRLRDFTNPITPNGRHFVRGIKIRFQGMGAGVTTVRRIEFFHIPEPATAPLAAIGLPVLVASWYRFRRRSRPQPHGK